MDRFPECGKPIDLDRGAGLSIDSDQVPEGLRHLVDFVNKWSFDGLDDQDVFVARVRAERPEEIAELNAVFDDTADGLIREWLVSLPFDKHADEFTDEDMRHPIWAFLNVLKLRETTEGEEGVGAVGEIDER